MKHYDVNISFRVHTDSDVPAPDVASSLHDLMAATFHNGIGRGGAIRLTPNKDAPVNPEDFASISVEPVDVGAVGLTENPPETLASQPAKRAGEPLRHGDNVQDPIVQISDGDPNHIPEDPDEKPAEERLTSYEEKAEFAKTPEASATNRHAEEVASKTGTAKEPTPAEARAAPAPKTHEQPAQKVHKADAATAEAGGAKSAATTKKPAHR